MNADDRYEAMTQTLEMIRVEYGGVEDYVKQVCGLSDHDIHKMRDRLLVKGGKWGGSGWTWGHVSRL